MYPSEQQNLPPNGGVRRAGPPEGVYPEQPREGLFDRPEHARPAPVPHEFADISEIRQPRPAPREEIGVSEWEVGFEV